MLGLSGVKGRIKRTRHARGCRDLRRGFKTSPWSIAKLKKPLRYLGNTNAPHFVSCGGDRPPWLLRQRQLQQLLLSFLPGSPPGEQAEAA